MQYLNKYNWTTNNKLSVVGYAWFEKQYLEKNNFLLSAQNRISDFNQFRNFVKKLNGQFSIIVTKENEVWATCCHTWSFPLFYKKSQNFFEISDQPEILQKNKEDTRIGSFAAAYFLQFGVTPLNQTLNETITQLKPGEIVCLNRAGELVLSDISLEFPFQPKQSGTIGETAKHLTTVFERYYEQIKNKQVLLPLTGGYDSRLLACLLAEFGHKNVLCATWGRKNNKEKRTAQKVAKKLGFKYNFIEYNEELIKDYLNDKTFKNYIKHAAHWSSMPYLQDYFAVKHLSENNHSNRNTIVMPGHPGDFLRGAHLNQSILQLKKEKLGAVLSNTLGTSLLQNKKFKSDLQDYLEQHLMEPNNFSPARTYEMWDLQERQCKFISNSNQVYSFFGIEVKMPLFDKQNLFFFQTIDANNQNREKLYNKTLEDFFFKKMSLGFDLKTTPKQKISSWEGWKNRIISLAPHGLKTHYYPMEDGIFYREITQQLQKNLKVKHPLKPHFFNAYIVQWYLHFLNK